jgi:hypothetical protein
MRLTRSSLVVALAGATAIAFTGGSLFAGGEAAFGSSAKQVAHAAHSGPEVGIGDENPQLFSNPAFQALHVKIARYFVPYDISTGNNNAERYSFEVWLNGAQAQGIQPLIAFYHNASSATKMPSVAKYTTDVKLFLAEFPQITNFQPWNEVNRGNVHAGKASYDSPSAKQSAEYYLALKKACPSRCTIVGLDVLDSTSPSATIRYINAFKHDVGKKHMPSVWGLHNYSDTNRFYDRGTRAVLNDVPGKVWLTETGGLAKLSPSFSFNLARQKRATSYMFKLADSSSRIKRLYIYQWYGGKNPKKESFDAGLANHSGTPRPAYCVVYEHILHTKKCPVKTAKN